MCFDYIIIIFCFVFEKKKAGPQKQHNTSPQVYLFAFFFYILFLTKTWGEETTLLHKSMFMFLFLSFKIVKSTPEEKYFK